MNLRRFILDTRTDPDRPNIGLEADDVYRILSARRRRLLLSVLAERTDDEVSVSELTRVVASREIDAEPLAVPEHTYERIYVALTQSHLPVLVDTNVVEWDRDDGVVRSNRPVSVLAEVISEIEQ